MTTIEADETATNINYVRLSEFYQALYKYDFLIQSDPSVYKGILQRGGEINYAVPADSLIKLHSPDLIRYTPHQFAAMVRNELVVELLLNHNADFTVKSKNGFTALRLAIQKGKSTDLRCLNLKGEFVNPIADLILLAHVSSGNITNPSCRNGISHFHIARSTPRYRIDRAIHTPIVLRVSKPPISINVGITAHFLPPAIHSGYGPLHNLVKGHALKTLELLLTSGSDVRPKNAAGLPPLQLSLPIYTKAYEKIGRTIVHRWTRANAVHGPTFMHKANNGLTMLHVVCLTHDRVVAKQVLELRENVNAHLDLESPIWPGRTPLHVLICRTVEAWMTNQYKPEDVTKIEGIAKLLLEYDAQANGIQSRGRIIDLLFRNPRIFEANPVNNERLTYFYVSCMGNEPNVVEEFLKRGLADVHRPKDYFAKTGGGFTPLHFAFLYGSRAVVKVLLRCGMDVSVEYCRGSTPLHVDAKLGGGGRLNNIETILRTALHLVVKFDSALDHAVKALLEHGADINVIDKKGIVVTIGLFERTHPTTTRISDTMEEVGVDKGYSLRDFLISEAALANYHVLSQQRLQAIVGIVCSNDLREKFPELGCLLKLQYRKALTRLKMMELVKDVLQLLA